MIALNISKRLGVLVCLLATTLGADALERPQGIVAARKQIQAGLSSGKGLILIIAEARTPRADDEAYGDWANNLNRFAGSPPAGVKLIRLTPATFGRLVLEPKLKEPFGTVFVRNVNHALVYDGLIVEQQIYRLGAGYVEAGQTPVTSQTYEASHHAELTGNGLVETRLSLFDNESQKAR